jgi:hypothetical protein
MWLLAIPAALLVFSFARYYDYWQYSDMTVSTLECAEPLEGDPSWSDMAAAGCEPVPISGEVVILDGGRQADKDPETDGARWTFDGVPSAFSTLGINAMLDDPAGRVYLVNAEAEPPQTLGELNGDVGGLTFSGRLEQGDSRSFYLVVSPRN